MPFSRYLQSNERENHTEDDLDHHAFSTQVHFQLPNLFNAPAVPPGGGAEALPAGLCPQSASLSWFNSQDGYNSAYPLPSAYHAASSASSSSSPQSASSTFPIPAAIPPSYANHHHDPPPFHPQLPLSIPSALGLPIYSASGFDLLSLLARVATRPYPKVYLGPVDLSCSFVVTDTRRFDAPIVYASPSFLKLSGYDEHEVIGRNCRFLQAPGGVLQRGQDRMHTSREAVNYMRKNIIADKECQVSVINYRKDGSAFINMVSVIPLPGGVNNSQDEADDVVYHIGFQVDLTEQPKSILSKLKDGSYVVNYSDKSLAPSAVPSRDWRTSSLTMRGMSKELRALLSDSAFTGSFQLSTSTHASTAIALSSNPAEPIVLDPYDGNKPLHMFLLDRSPDFLHVVSLKGAFLYVAPGVRHVLGYDPDELVGRSLTEFCHPADCVPLMRELKEASVTPGPSLLTTGSGGPPPSANFSASAGGSSDGLSPSSVVPRPVDLLFRMQAKGRGYVWVECRGRLHVEPGKGRKAIILSGRVRHMPRLEWGPISRAGGLVPSMARTHTSSTPLTSRDADGEADERSCVEREFWGLLSSNATFLYAGAAVRDVLGWGAGEVMGKPLADFVTGNSSQEVITAIEVETKKVLADAGGSESSGLACDALAKDGTILPVHVVLYRSRPLPSGGAQALSAAGDSGSHAPIVCQVKLCDGNAGAPPPANPITHPLGESVFGETEIERGSSWQYELQQLKFRNQRLAEEVHALEAGLVKKMRRKQPPNSAPTSAVAGPSVGVVHGRSHSGPSKMNEPPYAPSPETPMQPSQQQQQQQQVPLNVRFVSNGHGYPRTAPTQASRTYHTTAPVPPQPPLSHPHLQRTTVQQQLPPPSMVSPSSLQSYEASQMGNAAMYPPPRIPHSTESSLQGWSAYYEQTDHGGGGGGGQVNGGGAASVLHGRPLAGSFSGVPMKRTWDDLLRDPGGGGA
ncbi:PAS domain-containing protein [Cerioporus squamosus]|nr:PAS domain-containing protein [Cerioporus squamosus]